MTVKNSFKIHAFKTAKETFRTQLLERRVRFDAAGNALPRMVDQIEHARHDFVERARGDQPQRPRNLHFRVGLALLHVRNAEHREAFCRKMSSWLGVYVTGVESPEEAARGQSIVITATNAREPVLRGEWIEAGAHLNVVGSNFLSKAEVDVETIRRASIVAVDSIEQSRLESGDLLPAVERGVISWESVTELGRIVAGNHRGRTSESDITLFKSNGIALEDISTALRVYNLARSKGIGKEIKLWDA